METDANPLGAPDDRSGADPADDAPPRPETAQLLELERRVEDIEAQQQARGGVLENATRALFARLSETPSNFHQATVFYMASTDPGDKPMRQRAPLMLTIGYVMVVVQLSVTWAMGLGSGEPSCDTNDQCDAGLFCNHWTGTNANPQAGKPAARGRCYWCAEGPLWRECAAGRDVCLDRARYVSSETHLDENVCDGATETWNNGQGETFTGYINSTVAAAVCTDPDLSRYSCDKGSVVNNDIMHQSVNIWCDACVHAVSGQVDGTTAPAVMRQNVAAMGPVDWMAFFCASFVIGLTVAAELKDIRLCEIASSRVGADLTGPQRIAILLLGIARRYAFLPSIVVATIILVIMQGGDALSVCFNTIALLFLTELDNLAYAIGLSERSKRRIEASEMGRVDLSDTEAADLARTKIVHVLIVMINNLWAVWMIGTTKGKPIGIMVFSPAVAFWIGGMIEAATASTRQSESESTPISDTSQVGSTSSGVKRIAYASLQSLAGLVMYCGVFMAVVAL